MRAALLCVALLLLLWPRVGHAAPPARVFLWGIREECRAAQDLERALVDGLHGRVVQTVIQKDDPEWATCSGIWCLDLLGAACPGVDRGAPLLGGVVETLDGWRRLRLWVAQGKRVLYQEDYARIPDDQVTVLRMATDLLAALARPEASTATTAAPDPESMPRYCGSRPPQLVTTSISVPANARLALVMAATELSKDSRLALQTYLTSLGFALTVLEPRKKVALARLAGPHTRVLRLSSGPMGESQTRETRELEVLDTDLPDEPPQKIVVRCERCGEREWLLRLRSSAGQALLRGTRRREATTTTWLDRIPAEVCQRPYPSLRCTKASAPTPAGTPEPRKDGACLRNPPASAGRTQAGRSGPL